MQMKNLKRLLLIVLFLFLCASTSYLFIGETCMQDKIYNLLAVVIEATLMGTISFVGLYITISFQKNQSDKKEESKLCPIFIFEQNSNAILKSIETLTDKEKENIISDGSIDEKLISTNITIKNLKSMATALNMRLIIGHLQIPLCEGVAQDLYLKTCEGKHKLELIFENVYGLRYSEKIEYECIQKKFYFTYNQPRRI